MKSYIDLSSNSSSATYQPDKWLKPLFLCLKNGKNGGTEPIWLLGGLRESRCLTSPSPNTASCTREGCHCWNAFLATTCLPFNSPQVGVLPSEATCNTSQNPVPASIIWSKVSLPQLGMPASSTTSHRAHPRGLQKQQGSLTAVGAEMLFLPQSRGMLASIPGTALGSLLVVVMMIKAPSLHGANRQPPSCFPAKVRRLLPQGVVGV